MFCQKCGNEIAEGAAFCPKCGTKIEAAEGAESNPVSGTNTIGSMNGTAQMPVEKSKKPMVGKWWFWAIIVIAIAAVIFAISSAGGDGGEDAGAATGEDKNSQDTVKADADKTEEKSAAEIYAWLAENDEFDYTVPDKAVSFMASNPQFFPGNENNTGAMSDFVDYEADYPHVAKSPAKYADKLMHFSGDITDCEEMDTEHGIITYLQVMDYSGYSYCVYYLGELENAFEGSEVWGYALPFGTVTFENMGGYYTEAVMGAACYVYVWDYDEVY